MPRLALCAAVALLLTACGAKNDAVRDDSAPTPKAAATPPQADAGPAAPAAAERSGELVEREKEYRALALKNVCPNGYDRIQGRWRFTGQTRTPAFTDELEITGTRFVERLSGKPDGKQLDATIEGEMRCLFDNRVLVMVDKVTPPGAYDNKAGEAYPCDVLGPMDGGKDAFLLLCFFDYDVRPVKGKEFEYKRVQP